MAADHDKMIARKGRTAGLVIAGSMVAWLLLQWISTHTGWSQRVMVLFDLAVMAAMVWALVVTYQIWRDRAGSKDTKG